MKKLTLLLTLFAVVAAGVGVGRAQLVGSEGQVASFQAKLSPSSLPRERLVPVQIRTEGEFMATADNHLAELISLEIGVNRHGKMYTKGLPVCPLQRLIASSSQDALAACRSALIGHGVIRATTAFPEQSRAHFTAAILAFNGKGENGETEIYLHIFGTEPAPFTVIIPIEVRHTEGTFGTTFYAEMPALAGEWAYLTKFRFVFSRRFVVGGKTHSLFSANCPAPRGLSGAIFPFARATYRFRTTKTLRATLVGGCHVRNE